MAGRALCAFGEALHPLVRRARLGPLEVRAYTAFEATKACEGVMAK